MTSPSPMPGDEIVSSLERLLGKPPNFTPFVKIFECLSAQLKGQSSYTMMNEALAVFSRAGYASESEFSSIFETAYEKGETASDLTPRDRIVLRLFVWAAFTIYNATDSLDGNSNKTYYKNLTTIKSDTYTIPEKSQLVFDRFPEIKRVDLLGLGSDVIVEFLKSFATSGDINRTFIDSYNSKMNQMSDVNLIVDAVLTGPIYILWLGRNKWNIDWTWNGQ